MALSVDLNADMGEGIGNDAALLDLVTSANIACGFHAGSPDVMAATIAQATERGVGLGAHPGFDDRANFGRTRMTLSDQELSNLVAYQVGAAKALAEAAGGKLHHLKLHGAMANMAAEDAHMAEVCYRAALGVQPDLVIMVIAATQQQVAATALGVPFAAEIFADRAYNDDATLVDRSLPGAVLHDPAGISQRILTMLGEGAIVAESGTRIPCQIDTICLHGDTAEAVEIAASLRQNLSQAGVVIKRF